MAINPSISVNVPTFYLCGPVRLSSNKIWSLSLSLEFLNFGIRKDRCQHGSGLERWSPQL